MVSDSTIQHTASDDGTEIGYTVRGEGPPLVITHGSVSTIPQWEPVIEELSKTFTCYIYDRRGRGFSADSQHYSMDKEVADLQAVLEVAGPGALQLAHSYGALIALHHALKHGVDTRLILFEPPLNLERLVAGETLETYREAIAAGDNDRAMRVALENMVDVPAEAVKEISQSPLWPQLVELAPTWTREFEVIDGLGFDHSRFADLPAEKVHLLVGSQTTPMLAAATRKLKELLPVAGVTDMEGLDHFSHATAPTELAAHVVDAAQK